MCTRPIWQLSIELNLACAYYFKLLAADWQPCPVKAKFHFIFIFMLVSVTYYINLYVGEKRLVFHLSPRDGHVITVSARLILTAVNSSSYGWHTNCQFLQDLMWHFTSAYMKCVHRWAGVRYVITKFSRMDSLPNFPCPWCSVCARFVRARTPLRFFLSSIKAAGLL